MGLPAIPGGLHWAGPAPTAAVQNYSMQLEPALLLRINTRDWDWKGVTCWACCSVCVCVRVLCAGAFLLASLVSLPESPRWLVMRGQLDEALATLHTIVASSSSSKGRRRVRSWCARQAAMQQVRAAADAAAGLQPELAGASAAAEDAAWLNAAPEAGRPRNAEQQALEAAEDELLLLWSSVQKEQAAGLELRQAATGAAGPRSAAGSSNGAAAGGADGQVVVSATATTAAAGHGGGGAGAQHQQFFVQAAPAAAFSLDGEEDHSHPPHLYHHQQQQTGSPRHRHKQHQQQQLQIEPHPASSSSDAAPDLDGYVGGGHKGGTARLKALQQKLHLPGRSVGAGGDVEGQQQLLGPTAVNSSSSHPPHAPASQQQQQQPVSIPMPASDDHHQQQQPGLKKRLVEPGRESNVVVSLWAMLCDVRAVAKGPERAAFAIACCLAVFDQATASTAIINYAPEVLANRMGVEDPNLAIMYPAAIALAKVVGTLIAAVTVDKYGRRPLLFWGGVGCAVFLGLAGIALATSSVALFLAALCLFIFSFSMSWAGLYWVVVSEVFSMGAKSPATSAATSLLFLTGAAVNFVYLSLIGWIGGLAFALFGVVAAGSAWYVWARVPETKGRTLAEIQALLSPAAAVVGGSPVVSPRGRGGLVQNGSGSPMLPVVAQENGGSRLVELRQLMPSREPVQQ